MPSESIRETTKEEITETADNDGKSDPGSDISSESVKKAAVDLLIVVIIGAILIIIILVVLFFAKRWFNNKRKAKEKIILTDQDTPDGSREDK